MSDVAAESTDETTEETTEQVTETTTEQQAEQKTDWRESIKDEKAKKFASNYSTVEEAVKSALHFRQKLSNAVPLLGEDATDEDRENFYKKLGRPETAQEYGVELSENLTENDAAPLISMFQEAFFEAGIPKNAGEKILTKLFGKDGMYDMADKEETDSWNKNVEEVQHALRKEWGDEYDTNTKYAARAVQQFGSDEVKNLLDQATINGVELSNHPLITKMFAEIGRRMGEGGLQYIASESDHQSFDEEQNRLTEEAFKAQEAGDTAKADRLFRERDQKARAFYGE